MAHKSMLAILTGLSLLATVFVTQSKAGPVALHDKNLRTFLQKYLKGPFPDEDHTALYSATPVSLDGKTPMTLVYVSGRNWCGSGGCEALLLKPTNTSFKVIIEFSLARLPIQILPSRSHGWNDIAMPVAGGGIIPGYKAWLRFNGRKYPSNPSVAPKLPARMVGTGKDVPLKERGDPIY